uniref:Uncharacterized protein n=1 Tax=Arundo donax TaxID=35708 RepID=A0A0A9FTI9_ARUDO
MFNTKENRISLIKLISFIMAATPSSLRQLGGQPKCVGSPSTTKPPAGAPYSSSAGTSHKHWTTLHASTHKEHT